jgi:fructoselysine-6-P-deglycase FrlB-like protein
MPPRVESDAAYERLADRDTVILSGRRELQGIAEAGALFLMELARIPAFSLEGGQFRHGPLEALSPAVGVVLLRADNEWSQSVRRLAESCIAAGTAPVVLDASGGEPMPGTITMPFPAMSGLDAALGLLPSLQQLLLRVARHRVKQVGEPLRSTKVTGRE